MSLTLVEASKLALDRGETVRAGVIAMFARASTLLSRMPFRSIPGNSYAYNREGVLPSVAFRGVNESYTASTGVVNPLSEALRIAGGDLDVDRFLIDTQGAQVRSIHEQMKATALAHEITRAVIKGDSEANPREFDGWQKRVTGDSLIAAGTTDAGDALSMMLLDEAIDRCHGANAIVMNHQLRRRLTQAARNPSVGGEIDFSLDEFGRQVMSYNGIPIVHAYAEQGSGTDPLQFDEQGDVNGTPGGSSSASIYVVGFGDGMVSGIQNGMMQVRDLGELDTSPVMRTRVEWYVGQVVEHGRSLVRIGGIADAAFVA